jgi:effector-binding domain-containing protein/DNA-binding transcriptional MerR regulator
MELLAIGRFARLTGLTVRAIRHYAELGLLEPAYVDSDTGYRYYVPDQVVDAAAIRRLRFLELALDEIREIVVADDPSFTRARLLQHRAKMAELAATTEQILSTLQRLIDGEEKLVPDATDISDKVLVKEVPDTPVLVIREREPADRMSVVIPAAYAELEGYLGELGVEPTGPPITLCPYADDEGMVAVENSFPVDAGVPGRGRIEAAVLPGCTVLSLEHWGHYDELDRSYRALQAIVERAGLEVSGEPREIYWTDPEDLPVERWLTEVQFPVARDEARLATLG